jgi:hypothetical protein
MHRLALLLWRSDILRQTAIVAGGFAIYKQGRHAFAPNWPLAEENAHRVFHFEQITHLAWEGSLQRVFLEVPELIRALNVFYLSGHFILTGIFFVWLYFRSRDGFGSFRNGFLIATGLSLLIHWTFPTAPPRVAGVGLIDTLAQFSNVDIGSPTTDGAFSNPVAAVPSLHAGWALAVGVGMVLYGRWFVTRLVGVLYPAVVTLTIIVTGNHFVFDAIAGDLVMGIGFLVAWRFWPMVRGEPAPAAASSLPTGT